MKKAEERTVRQKIAETFATGRDHPRGCGWRMRVTGM